jgi:hypothetical protein
VGGASVAACSVGVESEASVEVPVGSSVATLDDDLCVVETASVEEDATTQVVLDALPSHGSSSEFEANTTNAATPSASARAPPAMSRFAVVFTIDSPFVLDY